MLALMREEGEMVLQKGCCVARGSWLSGATVRAPFGGEVGASDGQLTSALPSLQAHGGKRQEQMAVHCELLPWRVLGWCLRAAADCHEGR